MTPEHRTTGGAAVAEGVTLHVETRGDPGPTLLLLHGFAGSARNFRPQQRRLAEHFRVVAYDARGHARSAAPEAPADYGLDACVADALRVLEGQGAQRAVVGGLSMGAAVALALAHWAEIGEARRALAPEMHVADLVDCCRGLSGDALRGAVASQRDGHTRGTMC